jgi:hypothetical protein
MLSNKNAVPVYIENGQEQSFIPFDMSRKTQEVIQFFSSVYPYEEKEFYVRPCYPKVYDRILDSFRTTGRQSFVITGTPGIGNSLFMQYVFRRLQEVQEFKECYFVVSAFDEGQQKFLDGNLFRNGSYNEPVLHPYYHYNNSVHLYDGPPLATPHRARLLICFTSPHPTFFKRVAFKSKLKRLYLDPWTLEELQSAMCELNLDIPDMCSRYSKYGGDARKCLSLDLDNEEFECVSAVVARNFRSIGDILESLNGFSLSEPVAHSLFHLFPTPDRTGFVPHFASDHVKKLLVERSLRVESAQRRDLLHVLQRVPEAGSLRAWAFEAEAHEMLRKGGRFQCMNLQESVSGSFELHLECQAVSVLDHQRYWDHRSVEEAHAVCKQSTSPSIDSYVYQDGALYLFQCTSSATHPITFSGIIALLQHCHLMESFEKGDVDVKIIFVTDAHSLTPQEIIQPPIAKELTDIPCLGGKRLTLLKNNGIHSVDELFHAYNEGCVDKFSFIQKTVTHFFERCCVHNKSSLREKVQAIPQYRLTVEVSMELFNCSL